MYTPGPWELEMFPSNGAFVVRGNSPQPYGEDMVITKRDIGTVDPQEGEANARLIAAAPEMFGLLFVFASAFNKHGHFCGDILIEDVEAAKALLERMRGESK